MSGNSLMLMFTNLQLLYFIEKSKGFAQDSEEAHALLASLRTALEEESARLCGDDSLTELQKINKFVSYLNGWLDGEECNCSSCCENDYGDSDDDDDDDNDDYYDNAEYWNDKFNEEMIEDDYCDMNLTPHDTIEDGIFAKVPENIDTEQEYKQAVKTVKAYVDRVNIAIEESLK